MTLPGDQHFALVQMYADQDRLDELTGPPFEWYEPIITTRRDRIKIGHGSRIDSLTKLEGGRGLSIGRNVHVASFVHLNIGGGSLAIADGAAFASGSKVITGGNTTQGVSMSASALPEEQNLYARDITIGKNAAILTNAVLISANMGEGAVLASGAVCRSDIPAFEVWGGIPAKRIALRQGHRFGKPHAFVPHSPGNPLCECGLHLAHQLHERRA